MNLKNKILVENIYILTISSALIISEFYFFNSSWRVLGSSHYLIFNTLILFLFSLIFIFFFIKLVDKVCDYFSKNLLKFITTIFFTFVYFKIIQIPFFLANKIYLKNFFEMALVNILTKDFYFLLPYLKILLPFLLIFLLLYIYLFKNFKLIINFALSFGLVFFVIMSVNSFKRFEHMKLNKKPVIEQNSNRQVIWFLFDEFDPRYFKDKKIELKNFDKLIETSVFQQKSYSPSNATLISMPSILMSTKTSGYKIENRNLKIINNEEIIPFEIENTLFQDLNDKNYSYQIISETIPYCTLLKINFNCVKDFTKIKHFFDGIKQTYIPSDYYKKIKDSFLDNKKFNFKELNSFNEYDNEDLLVSNKFNISLSDLDRLINNNDNLIFFHLYLPHTDYNLDDPLSTKYVRDFFNFKISSNNEEYYLNLKFLDILIDEIIKIISNNKNDEILLLLTSDHWRRSDSPSKAEPSLFIAKIKNDNFKVNISKNTINTHIPDLIIKYLDSKVKNHQDVKKYLESFPEFNPKEVHVNK